MDVKKIYVTVDNKDYAGLYWIVEENSFFTISVSFESVKNNSLNFPKADGNDLEKHAKKMLFDLITSLK